MVFNGNCDFEKAIKLCEEEFSYNELIDLLKKDNIAEKQFAILNLNEIKTTDDANLLCSNLIGQDGKIREAVSFKLAEFFNNNLYAKFFINDENFKIMLEGLMDINGNVCRNILEIDNNEFNNYLAKNIINKIEQILDEISKLEINDKQYVISKRNFQLYWALEGVCKIHNIINFGNIEQILIKTADFEDYTIKEKTAKILSLYKKEDTESIKDIIKKNSNYYIERYL